MTPMNVVHGAEAALRAWSLRSLGLAVCSRHGSWPPEGGSNSFPASSGRVRVNDVAAGTADHSAFAAVQWSRISLPSTRV
jgi:hypothetical protein